MAGANLDDTIVAVATPPGRGGIGVVRLSGPESRAIAAPMLRLKQDLEAGRPLELEAVVGAVIELGERMGVAMPSTRAVYACTKLLAANRVSRS